MVDIERAELLRTWVAALRSGKYVQTKGALHRSDGSFCGIGVLHDVGRVEGEEWQVVEDHSVLHGTLDLGEAAAERIFNIVRMPRDLFVPQLNDIVGLSFPEIADEIERHYPDVFGEKAEPANRSYSRELVGV